MDGRLMCAQQNPMIEGPPPNVLRIVGENREHLQILSRTISSLETRLDRVLCGACPAPGHPCPSTGNPPRPAMSTLAEEMDDHGREIVSMTNRLDNIMSRLEV